MVEITGAKIWEAYRIFKKAYGSGRATAEPAFKKIVSIPHLGVRHYGLTKAEAERIEMLNGERGHFYAKVLIARMRDG